MASKRKRLSMKEKLRFLNFECVIQIWVFVRLQTRVESDEEKDDTQDQEKDLTPQIGSLQEALTAVQGVREYISSIDTQNISLFTNAVKLQNALIHAITMHRANKCKQAKVTDLFNKC
ncbi:Hypothetical protein CINCED_3A002757 [Cinara cedri]|uniref:Uncharacterized protein n=1 Tax=Cinara cedri TaxID=506608 RepID=A0A5E4NT17_9HEMI|nr:Hypothetical protein CINCED_3A002757 [Cinara cedri]